VSRRALAHLLQRANAAVIVAECGDRPLDDRPQPLVGSVIVLFREGGRLARIYSIAVSPKARGHGLGGRLVEAAEVAARQAGRTGMRLEVRKDNAASIALFEKMGYQRFGEYVDYYEDHMDAWRYEKHLPAAP
jgi:ribosomal protein S18 acetylase RimI-like enzyme